jgi:hypothetical protein
MAPIEFVMGVIVVTDGNVEFPVIGEAHQRNFVEQIIEQTDEGRNGRP